jgi:hypothetical protein
MHTVQLLLIEADTHQEAVEIVDSKITDWEGHWSDWHAIGGRWSGIFGENHPDVINYKNEPELFEKHIKDFVEGRKNHLKENLKKFEEGRKSLSDYVSDYNPEIFDFDMNLYALKSLTRIMAGDWTYDSCFYDLEAYSETLQHFRERVATHPERQFAVAVDFHF